MVVCFINCDVCLLLLKNIGIVLVLIFMFMLLVVVQFDLGILIFVVFFGLFVLFFFGFSWCLIGVVVVLVVVFILILWFFLMYDYQCQCVMMFLDLELDLFGVGYYIIQFKIVIGFGGLCGKGWLYGIQLQFEFFFECYIDFIFVVLVEELGLVGILILFVFYILLIMCGLWIVVRV